MAEIGCTSGCSCHASEDGYWANDPLKGRRNTVVEGTGTPSDPWTISFIDSAQYRPVAGEIKYPDQSLNGGTLNLPGTGTTVVYDTPNSFVWYSPPTSINLYVAGNYFVVGAAAEFEANAATGRRALYIRSGRDLPTSVLFAGATTGDITTENMVLTAVGYSSGLFTNELSPFGVAPQAQYFIVSIASEANAAIAVRKLKFWATTI